MSNHVLSLNDASIFQGENLVLADVSITIEKGEFVYLIGKTGTGKSSFMKTLYGDLPLQKGEGNIVGYDLPTLKESDIPFLRRKLGVVFQDFKLLNDRTVHENLNFVLTATGWTDKAEKETRINDVLSNNPELILADEPTGNLDPQTSVEVMEVLREINKNGNTILMATHDYALLLKYPSKTLKCEDNQIFEVVQKTV